MRSINLRGIEVLSCYPVCEVNGPLMVEGDGCFSVALGMKFGSQCFVNRFLHIRMDAYSTVWVVKGASMFDYTKSPQVRHAIGSGIQARSRENLSVVLARRAADLAPPIQMCDALSRQPAQNTGGHTGKLSRPWSTSLREGGTKLSGTMPVCAGNPG